MGLDRDKLLVQGHCRTATHNIVHGPVRRLFKSTIDKCNQNQSDISWFVGQLEGQTGSADLGERAKGQESRYSAIATQCSNGATTHKSAHCKKEEHCSREQCLNWIADTFDGGVHSSRAHKESGKPVIQPDVTTGKGTDWMAENTKGISNYAMHNGFMFSPLVLRPPPPCM